MIFGLILGLTVPGAGQTTDLVSSESQITYEICSTTLEGFQLCTTSLEVSAKLGEKIIVSMVLKNTTQDDLWVMPDSVFNPIYLTQIDEYDIMDQDGIKLLSKYDSLKKKDEDHTISQEESSTLFSMCCIDRGSRGGYQLAPNKVLRYEVDLSDVIEFPKKGKYYVGMGTRVLKRAQPGNVKLVLPTISVELR